MTTNRGIQPLTGTVTVLQAPGRSTKALNAAFTSTAVAETAIMFQVSSAAGALSVAANFYTVTAGKTLRIQSVNAAMRTAGTLPAATNVTLRIKVGGNQQGMGFQVATGTAAISTSVDFTTLPSTFADGLEYPAGSVLSFTLAVPGWVAVTNTPILDLSLFGFEY